MYFHPESGRTFANHGLIRKAMTNSLFPDVMDDAMLAFVGVYPVIPTKSGATDQQTAIEGLPALVDGQWRQTWTVRDATPEELAAGVPDA
jgi:hypothetical protein